MSLDLWMETPTCQTCGETKITDELNYTYNVYNMWKTIFSDAENMVDIDGLTGKQSIEKLKFALETLINEPETFTALNPKNGWGSYDGFKKYISQLITLAESHPSYIWKSAR